MTVNKEPGFFHALSVFTVVFLTLSVGLFRYQFSLHILVFASILWVGIHARLLGYQYKQIQQMMFAAVTRALPAITIFLLIGMVIASLMHSGTIASLIYHGLNWLSPSVFLPLGLILCALMSLATGTSWGTVGTLGVVLMGLGVAMNIPLPLVAGVVISGATFGDKLSPVSDTTNLAAMSAEVNLYQHIRSMLYTTVPAFAIAILVFWYLGKDYGVEQYSQETVQQIQAVLAAEYQLSIWVTLLPIVVMLGLSLWRFPAEISMVCCVMTAVLVALLYQDSEAVNVVNALWQNQAPDTGLENIDNLLGRGGLNSMSWTLLLSMLALALGGVLHQAGFLRVLVWGVIARLEKVGSLVAATIGFGVIGNLAMGEAYITIILNSQLFKHKYEASEVSAAVMSRSVEEGATQTTGLIPWTTAGAFYAATLDVQVLDYLPYAIFNYINPMIGILFAYLGIGLMRKKKLV
ncbi:Na+/H+ antiporter NhaC [Marinicella sp. W31]|uniref:Na+/H+ antiporter NhaC n=1 Tax=Marinicella sp. W31 TaxID=3023713 RepID=UPI0037564081